MPLEIRSSNGEVQLGIIPDVHGVKIALSEAYGGGEIIYWFTASPTSATHHRIPKTPADGIVSVPEEGFATLKFGPDQTNSVIVQRIPKNTNI